MFDIKENLKNTIIKLYKVIVDLLEGNLEDYHNILSNLPSNIRERNPEIVKNLINELFSDEGHVERVLNENIREITYTDFKNIIDSIIDRIPQDFEITIIIKNPSEISVSELKEIQAKYPFVKKIKMQDINLNHTQKNQYILLHILCLPEVIALDLTKSIKII